MSDFNKDEYLNDLPDMDNLSGQAAPAAGASQESQNNGDSAASATSDSAATSETAANAASSESQENGDAADGATQDGEDTLTPLGQAKKEAAEYLEALQRERAEFINFRNRSQKEQERFRQHGIIDVLTALLPALDDIDRIREHSEMDESFKAVSAKIDKAFEKFGVEKFGEKGEDFDPTKHDAILHKPDPQAEKETVDTVVEAGYRIGDRVIRAARVVGAFVMDVYPGEAADNAGIQKSDIITKLDGQKVSSKADINDKLQYYSAGEEIEIEVARLNNGEYEESTVTVTLSARPDGNQ